jgi:hypothetical protein
MAEQSRDRQKRQGDEAPPTLDIDGTGGLITDLIPGGLSDGQNFFACPGGATGNVVAGLHIDPCERRELFAMTRGAQSAALQSVYRKAELADYSVKAIDPTGSGFTLFHDPEGDDVTPFQPARHRERLHPGRCRGAHSDV